MIKNRKLKTNSFTSEKCYFFYLTLEKIVFFMDFSEILQNKTEKWHVISKKEKKMKMDF